jgi:hypothetical protein
LLVIVALPAVDVSKNPVKPPTAPLIVPPLLVIVALPAVDVFKNPVAPPTERLTIPPLLRIVALPAVDVFKNSVSPPTVRATALPSLVIAALPAVDMSTNIVSPRVPGGTTPIPTPGVALTPPLVIVCVFPELFTIPAPSRVSTFPFVLIVKAFARGLKVIDSTVALPERISEVTAEVLNVAVSPRLTGAIGDVDQLVPAFQKPEPGLGSQTASTASTGVDVATNIDSATTSAPTASMQESLLGGWVVTLIGCVFIGTAFMDG